MTGNDSTEQAEAFVASDYQGETIQVFVFFRGKFLGYQCFGQDKVTVGGSSRMDLSLPDCPEEEGYWDVYVSRGALYAWLRSPAGGNGKEGHEDPQRVQPLDSFSLGEYRLQAKLLEGRGFVLPSSEKEEDSGGGGTVSPPKEEESRGEPAVAEKADGEGEAAMSSPAEPDQEEASAQEPEPEPSDEVEGISLDYARSIWADEAETEARGAADAEKGEPGEADPDAEPVEEAVPVEREEPSAAVEERMSEEGEEALSGEPQDLVQEGQEKPSAETGPEEAGGFWALSEGAGTGQEMEAGRGAAVDDPDLLEDEVPRAEEIDEWIGFGLEEADPEEQAPYEGEPVEGPQPGPALDVQSPEGMGEEEARFEPDPEPGGTMGPEEQEAGEEEGEGLITLGEEEEGLTAELAAPELDADEHSALRSPPADGSGALVEGMSREERTKFWDEMAREAFANEQPSEGKRQEEEVRSEEAPAGATAAPSPAEEEVRLPETLASAEGIEGETEAAVTEDADGGKPGRAEVLEYEHEYEHVDEDEDDDEDEAQQDVTYFSLVKEIFPSRTNPSKAPRGDHRALEIVRFRGSDVQDIGYLESGDSYAIRRGWSRSLWKRKGGVPPDFKLVRLKNGGLAELHLRESVKGRLYSDAGSQDIWDLRGGKRGRLGLKGKASWLPLPADTWAVLRVNSGRYLVRYVSPRPKPVVQPLRPNLNMGQFKLVSVSLLSHLLLILVIGLAVPDSTLEGYNRVDQFARIDPDALKALKPPPPPKKLDKPKPVAKKKAPKPKPKPPVASKHTIPKSARKSPVPTPGKAGGGGGKKQVDVAQTGLLAALGSPDAGVLDAKGNSEILLAAVTNLDAVAVPSDTTTFNLAGVAGKLATSEIQVPTSEEIETVGAAQLIKNGDGTLGAMASKGSGEVRAVVHEPPKAKISIRGGMSREAVLKVVNAHLDEVRDCYERELLHNPGISGKILMEWLIQLDGTVRYAKVKFTNIGHSSDLHSCLQAQVVTWNFPRPKGGEEVLVTFPFLFESMGF